MTTPEKYSVAVVGGSFSGMAASLQLARAQQTVIVIDDERPCNLGVERSHGFLGFDGVPPAEISRHCREQLTRYPTVHWKRETVEAIVGEKDDFVLKLRGGSSVSARRIILASGASRDLPEIPGLVDVWTKTAFSCPYCHGYEFRGERLGLLRVDQAPIYEAMVYPDWGKVTLLMNGEALGAAEQDIVQRRGVVVDSRRILRFDTPCMVHFEDGASETFGALFLNPPFSNAPLVKQTGCETVDTPLGFLIKVDNTGQTSVPGMFACGNTVLGTATIADAVASGSKVGRAVHVSFRFKVLPGAIL